MSGFLSSKRAYLSGPIQFATEDKWREYPTAILTEKFKIDLFDPFKDSKQNAHEKIRNAQKKDDIEQMVAVAKGFVRKDLGIIDRCDFIIAYVPYGVQTVGTVHEIINSNNAKKPTLLVTNRNHIKYIPLWYFGFVPTRYMFASWDELYLYLSQVDEGLHRHDDRWSLMYGDV
jgi:nucleoside 2-deoxyribosyltransferase